MTKEELLTKKLEEFAQIIPDASPSGFTMPFDQLLEIDRFWNEEIQSHLSIGKQIEYANGREKIFEVTTPFEVVLQRFRDKNILSVMKSVSIVSIEYIETLSQLWYHYIHPRIVMRRSAMMVPYSAEKRIQKRFEFSYAAAEAVNTAMIEGVKSAERDLNIPFSQAVVTYINSNIQQLVDDLFYVPDDFFFRINSFAIKNPDDEKGFRAFIGQVLFLVEIIRGSYFQSAASASWLSLSSFKSFSSARLSLGKLRKPLTLRRRGSMSKSAVANHRER